MGQAYDRYLSKHKTNVKKGFDWIRDHLPELIVGSTDYEWQIGLKHDQSKNEPDEYYAYDAYFYGGNRAHAVVEAFHEAFLRHLHRNPHHWQHWILPAWDDKEGEKIFEMPYNYILEMVCDWWSFSWDKGNLEEIFTWYAEHGAHMKLHPNTRKTVVHILEQIKSKIERRKENDK